jgi:AcrR family transcriptional regulator
MVNDIATTEKGRPTSGGDRRQRGRRQEYAEATRQAIIDAARQLFAERGYFSTRVEDIAAAARVAPATVYAGFKSKFGLIQALVDTWSTAPAISATDEDILRLADPVAIIRRVAAGARGMREEYGDIMRTLVATAPNDQAVAATMQAADVVYRDALTRISQRIAEVGALREGVDVEKATDMLWLYFGYAGLFVMHDDNGWTWDEAEEWLADQAIHALLAHD